MNDRTTSHAAVILIAAHAVLSNLSVAFSAEVPGQSSNAELRAEGTQVVPLAAKW